MDETGSSSDNGNWAVVKTHPHKEALAITHLERQSFPTYCPMVRRRSGPARRAQDVMRPLFPSYVFVKVRPDRQQWRPILSTMGVGSLIRVGERPGVLGDTIIRELRAREKDGAIVQPPSPYRKGQRVRLVEGAFEGVVAEILSVDAAGRIEILMQLMQRSVRAKVNADQVFVA